MSVCENCGRFSAPSCALPCLEGVCKEGALQFRQPDPVLGLSDAYLLKGPRNPVQKPCDTGAQADGHDAF